MLHKRIIYLTVLILFPLSVNAQWFEEIVEFLTVYPNKKAVAQDSTLYPNKLILTPVLTYTPETSLAAGLGAKYLFKFSGSGEETRTSNMPISFTYTLNNQVELISRYDVFFQNESYLLSGNLELRIFPQFYYGIGRNTPESNEETYSFSQVLVSPLIQKNIIVPFLFVGGGVRYNQVGNFNYEADSRLKTGNVTGSSGSRSLGTEFAITYDDRDNILNALSGWYARVSFGIYRAWMGSTQSFERGRIDIRKYIPLNSEKHILALQLKSDLSFGNVPFVELAALGGDQIMRGYYQGRYLDNHLLALQAEYRFTVYSRFGGVVFAGVGDVVSALSDFQLQNFRPSVGAGLRILIEKKENLNLRLDYGFGRKNSSSYFKVAEAF